MVKIIQDFIPTSLPTRPETPLDADYITVHNTDNTDPGAGAAAHNRYVRSDAAVQRGVSWHYTVDDRVAYQHLPTDEVGWHAGHSANSSSIGIEICMNSDMNKDLGYQNAAALVAHFVTTSGLPFPGCMKQHNSWTGKNCPSVIRAGQIITWAAFLNKVQEILDAKSGKGSTALLELEIPDPDAPAWSPENAGDILKSIDESFAEHAHEDGDIDD